MSNENEIPQITPDYLMEKPVSQEEIDNLIEQSKHLPKASVEDLNSHRDGDNLYPYNNFFLLFVGLRNSTNPETEEDSSITSLKKAEGLGAPWKRFVEQNKPLIEEINKVLKDYDIYYNLRAIVIKLLKSRDYKREKEFSDRIAPGSGLTAIEIPLWQKLNELLAKAGEEMKRVGIDPEQFYI